MINDKSLKRALLDCRGMGYTLAVQDGEWMFLAPSWCLQTCWERVHDYLRETLGLIVEQLGFIPTHGAVCVMKVKDVYLVQNVMMDTVGKDAAGFAGKHLRELKYTGLHLGSAALYQGRDTIIYGLSAGGPIVSGDNMLNIAGCLVTGDDGDALYQRLDRPDESSDAELLARWKHLEARMWVDWRDEEAAEAAEDEEEDAGQETFDDMEDGDDGTPE